MSKKGDPTVKAEERFSQALLFQVVGEDCLGLDTDKMSPIERLFLWELLAQATITGVDIRSSCNILTPWSEELRRNGFHADETNPIFSIGRPCHILTVANEVSVGKYRCDFLIEVTDLYVKHAIDNGIPCEFPLLKHLAIECDGHDFHEKTKKQAAHDRSRDRFFLEQGLHIMRFTGSELWKDSGKCARQALGYVDVKCKFLDEMATENPSLSGFRKR